MKSHEILATYAKLKKEADIKQAKLIAKEVVKLLKKEKVNG